MARDAVNIAVAANRDVPQSPAGPFQDCRDVVHIAIFFDGTGNNKDFDDAESKWSNVARLYESAQIASLFRKDLPYYPIYISGVGTKFNGEAVGWLSGAGIWAQDQILGLGVAAGGDRRMEYGNDAVNTRLREVLIANARALGGSVAKYAEANKTKSFGEVNNALAKHRLIKVINMSFFGFSRGAALARAFSNRVIAQCTKADGGLLYNGYAIRFNFMGVFDTVASFGVPAQNVRPPFSERDLIVSPAIERCVHYVAAHEVRFSFPVDLIRKNGELAGAWVEKTFPGVHSDVGGGYEPSNQEIDNNYARIPMREMMRESLLSGVRMLSYDELEKRLNPLFGARFECRQETEAAYARYIACVSNGGSIEQQITEHLKVYYSAYGTMHRNKVETAGARSRQSSKFKYKYVIGSKGMAYEVWAYRFVRKAGEWLRLSDSTVRGYAQFIKIQDWQLAAWDSTAEKGVVEFVSRFIHDSKVDFLGNIEPFSYFRPRGVDESSISVWQEGGNWLRGKAKIIDSQVGEAVAISRETAREAARAAKEAADAAQRRAVETAEFARRKANEAAALANTAYDAASRAAREAADVAAQTASDASAFASRKSKEAAAAAYNTAEAFRKGAVAVGKQTIEMVESSGERIYENGSSWIKRTIKASDESGS